jgi:hypothetical protein
VFVTVILLQVISSVDNILGFSANLLSTYILLVSSLFSIGVVVVTVILLQVKSVDDIILFCFVYKSSIVI